MVGKVGEQFEELKDPKESTNLASKLSYKVRTEVTYFTL